MPSFEKLFIDSKGQPITYKGRTLVLVDKFPVSNEDTLLITIEKSSTDRREGVAIDITGHCQIDWKVFKPCKGVMMLFWADTADNPTRIKVFTKEGFVRIKNIWEQTNTYLVGTSANPLQKESKSVESGYNGAAMIVEEIENGRRYRCNDGEPDDDFDDIVFTIQRV